MQFTWGWKTIIPILVVFVIGIRIFNAVRHAANRAAEKRAEIAAPARAERGEDFVIDGILSIPSAKNVTWSKTDDGKDVTLEKTDGTQITVSSDALSTVDAAYLKRQTGGR